MREGYKKVLALFLAVAVFAPSGYFGFAGIEEARAAEATAAAVPTVASVASATTVCSMGGWVGGIMSDFTSWLGFGEVVTFGGMGATATAALTVPNPIVPPAKAYESTAAGLAPLVVPTQDSVAIMQRGSIDAHNMATMVNAEATKAATVQAAKETSVASFATCVLNPLTVMLRDIIIRKITDDILVWIRSGFQGQPAFLTDPSKFFRSVAEQTVSSFLYESGMDQYLCSPFRVDVIFNFMWNWRTPKYSKWGELSCSLNEIFSQGIDVNLGVQYGEQQVNDRYNRVVNNSIVYTEKMDFGTRFKMTKPANNPMGVYVRTGEEAIAKAAESSGNEKSLLDQNGGWFSTRCDFDKDGVMDGVCTPGSFIAKQIDAHTDSVLTRLNLADSFGEIMDALFQALIQKILTKAQGDYGLLHVSSSG